MWRWFLRPLQPSECKMDRADLYRNGPTPADVTLHCFVTEHQYSDDYGDGARKKWRLEFEVGSLFGMK
jgi:hypothetical protein